MQAWTLMLEYPACMLRELRIVHAFRINDFGFSVLHLSIVAQIHAIIMFFQKLDRFREPA